MQASLRHRLSPVAGVVTLGLGLGFVVVLQFFSSLIWGASTGIDSEAPVPILRPLESVTAPNGVLELSCYDPHILPIWRELKQDSEFRARLAIIPGQYNCSELVEIEREDLNGDREAEFIVWGKDIKFFCGATANCNLWIFGIRNGRMKQLLDSGGIGLEFGRKRHNGFRNVTVRFNGSSYPDSLLEYQFDGIRFRLARCYDQDKQSLEKWEESCEGW